jgi:transcription elongation factor Elf1
MSDQPDQLPTPCEITPDCPICQSPNSMTLAAHHKEIIICVCIECGTSMSVPEAAMREWSKRRATT